MFAIESNLTRLLIGAALYMASLFAPCGPAMAAEPIQASSQQDAIGSASLSNRG